MPIPCYLCRDGEPHEDHRPDALARLRQLAITKGLSPFLIERLRREALLEAAVASVALDNDPRLNTVEELQEHGEDDQQPDQPPETH